MGSSSKQRSTMAKRNRENAVRERRQLKAAKKELRKRNAAEAAIAPSEPPAEDAVEAEDSALAPVPDAE
jgi:hypothetical protein